MSQLRRGLTGDVTQALELDGHNTFEHPQVQHAARAEVSESYSKTAPADYDCDEGYNNQQPSSPTSQLLTVPQSNSEELLMVMPAKQQDAKFASWEEDLEVSHHFLQDHPKA